MKKHISVLGSTGSVGRQTLDVIRNNKEMKAVALTANSNITLLEEQAREFMPEVVSVMDEDAAKELRIKLSDTNIKVLCGMSGLVEASTMDKADCVLTAVVGNVGMLPTFEAIKAGKDIALANKETLVSAGSLITEEIKKNGVKLLPVDSEHSAIFQCINGTDNAIKRILLTASGGSFRGRKREELKNVKPADALKHPTWSMGRKITIDSATLMNKGLEVIEAKWLFGVDVSQIEVLVHPQSIVHSAVEFADNSVIAQLSVPDMRLAIQYALTAPERIPCSIAPLDFSAGMNLTFGHPDTETFECLSLAYKAVELGGTLPTVMNAANEIAVERFLSEDIGFLQIAEVVGECMNAHSIEEVSSIEQLMEIDLWARDYAKKIKL
ncbi:MAG: 1-deoxy-D-xylulose-5-phosphate reductoisomerase [Anaerofustis stercorihominis]|nr:1-deoxy-D-xylulose-5-phosphate reductoisomerase [Anaerofustis stercorihominis]